MEKLQHVFTLSGQKYGGLMLDLHCNRFGPTALFQVCNYFQFCRLKVEYFCNLSCQVLVCLKD